MGFFTTIFGSDGGATTVFGGFWFIVAFFILIFFLLILFTNSISAENVIVFVLIFFLTILSNGLFEIPIEWIMTIVIIIMLFIGLITYNIFSNK